MLLRTRLARYIGAPALVLLVLAVIAPTLARLSPVEPDRANVDEAGIPPSQSSVAAGPTADFIDTASSVHRWSIRALALRDITHGCDSSDGGEFCPNRVATRAEAAAILARALELPADRMDHFTDDDDSRHEAEINAVASARITFGCNQRGDRFCPDAPLLRGQAAAFLARGFGIHPTQLDYFVDDDRSSFRVSIDAIAAAGLTAGCNPPNNDRFCPWRPITRGELATLVARGLGLVALAPRASGEQPRSTGTDDPTARDREPEPVTSQREERPAKRGKRSGSSTTRSTTTTTRAPAPAPRPPAALPTDGYGASRVGPANESCERVGVVVDAGDYQGGIEGAGAGATVLLRGGTYDGGFTVPEGRSGDATVVKPYGCESVRIEGAVGMGSWTTVAGLFIESSGVNWTIELSRDSGTPMSNVTVRNNVIRGGEVEAIRVARNVHDVEISGNDLDGGEKRHVLKVHWEGSRWRPSGIRIVNNVFHKDVTGGGTDLIQLEGHQTVLIERNTFHEGGGENGVDVKSAGAGGGVTIRGNYFDGATIVQGCLLVQGDFANNVVEGNFFDNGCKVALGAHPEGEPDPWWRFESNVIDDGGTLQIRRSFDAEIINNTMDGGTLTLGLSAGDDYPRDAVIVGNTFTGVDLVDRVTPAGDSYTCHSNQLMDVSGFSQCD